MNLLKPHPATYRIAAAIIVMQVLAIVAFASDRQLVILVNGFHPQDPINGDRDTSAGYLLDMLETQFPGTEAIIIEGDNLADINQKLRIQLQGSQKKVKALVVNGHGSNLKLGYNGVPFHSPDPNARSASSISINSLVDDQPKAVTIGKDGVVSYVAKSDGEILHLNHPLSVKRGFGALRGHWADDPKIIFNSCSLLTNETLGDVHLIMERVASNFGLKSGRIYMNFSVGTNGTTNLLLQPAWGNPSWKWKGLTLWNQMVWPVAARSLMRADMSDANQGYTLVLEPNGNSKLFRDHLYGALLFRDSLEEREHRDASELKYAPKKRRVNLKFDTGVSTWIDEDELR